MVVAIRALLWVTRLQRIRRFLDTRAWRAAGGNRLRLERVIWAVETAAAYSPIGTTCLAEALTAQFLLRGQGYASKLCIGAAIEETGNFLAHAWLQDEGTILIGGPPSRIARYKPFKDIDRLTA